MYDCSSLQSTVVLSQWRRIGVNGETPQGWPGFLMEGVPMVSKNSQRHRPVAKYFVLYNIEIVQLLTHKKKDVVKQ